MRPSKRPRFHSGMAHGPCKVDNPPKPHTRSRTRRHAHDRPSVDEGEGTMVKEGQ